MTLYITFILSFVSKLSESIQLLKKINSSVRLIDSVRLASRPQPPSLDSWPSVFKVKLFNHEYFPTLKKTSRWKSCLKSDSPTNLYYVSLRPILFWDVTKILSRIDLLYCVKQQTPLHFSTDCSRDQHLAFWMLLLGKI